MLPNVQVGYLMGTGAAVNVELGYIPDFVRAVNVTDGDIEHIWFRGRIMPFTSGGTAEVKPGDKIKGDTTGVIATVRQVLLKSGTWAGGDAAGDILFHEEDETGAFGSENVSLLARDDGTSQGNVATVTAQAEKANLKITTAVATETPANGIQPYRGADGVGKGFTLTATASESAKLFAWVAMRNGEGTSTFRR